MTKSDLIDKIAEKAGRSKSDAEQFLNATLSTIQDTLSSGESIPLVGFGTFSVASRAARTGKNPPTGAAIPAPRWPPRALLCPTWLWWRRSAPRR